MPPLRRPPRTDAPTASAHPRSSTSPGRGRDKQLDIADAFDRRGPRPTRTPGQPVRRGGEVGRHESCSVPASLSRVARGPASPPFAEADATTLDDVFLDYLDAPGPAGHRAAGSGASTNWSAPCGRPRARPRSGAHRTVAEQLDDAARCDLVTASSARSARSSASGMARWRRRAPRSAACSRSSRRGYIVDLGSRRGRRSGPGNVSAADSSIPADQGVLQAAL